MDDQYIASTAELLSLAREGNLESKRALIDRYYPRVQRIVRARMGAGVRRSLESGDLTQIVLLEILRDLDGFDFRSEGELMNWMSIEVERRLRDQVRRSQAKKRDLRREVSADAQDAADEGEAQVRQFAHEGPGPRTMTQASEEQALVDSCVHELPVPERTLIILRDYEGHSWAEVARLTEKPSADAARMAHGHAMRLLAMKLKARGVRPDVTTALGS
ncbi:MAG: sigma-70 family RNA polymerase sigma factor [Planctomycetota bacterium]